MEEILEASILLVPFEVTFYGEEAADHDWGGGARKEFLTVMMQEILKEERRLFEMTDDGIYILKDDIGGCEKKYCFGAELVCDICN
ncbi:hypothetical protein CHS0354_019794, partial [Potamilus streckersoni]